MVIYMKTYMCLFVCLFVGSAVAGTIYDESIDGDLTAHFDSPKDAFNITTTGSHTWLGSSYVGMNSSGGLVWDDDWWTVTLANNFVVSDLLYSVNNLGGLPIGETATVAMNAGPNQYQRRYDLTTDLYEAAFGDLALLNDGVFDIRSSFSSCCSTAAVEWTAAWDYEITLVVADNSPVPVPAAVWLMGSGLLGLLSYFRNRKTEVATA